MFLEEFSPTFKYCPGKDNILTHAFSHLSHMAKLTEGKSVAKRGKLIVFEKLKVPNVDEDEIY